MDNIDIRLLRAFLALMSARSVTRAADQLGVGQSALSQSLARLRTLFGDPLLVRSRGAMIPTDRAREIETAVRAMVAAYDGVFAERAPFDPRTSQRRFIVSAPEYAESMLMPRLLARLRREAPNVRLEVRAPLPERAIEQLESGELDLRIAWLITPPLPLRSMPLFQDQLVCLASARHSQVRGAISLAQYLSLPHVQPLGTGRPTTAQVLTDALGQRTERPFLVQNFMTIPRIVAGSDMIATLPRMLAKTFMGDDTLQLLELPVRLPRIRYAAYWHERSHKDAGHRWLRTMIGEIARSEIESASRA